MLAIFGLPISPLTVGTRIQYKPPLDQRETTAITANGLAGAALRRGYSLLSDGSRFELKRSLRHFLDMNSPSNPSPLNSPSSSADGVHSGVSSGVPATVNGLVHSILSELGPEIRARQIELDIDLDSVPLRHQAATISTAIRGLIANSLQSAPHRGQISITLIDSADQWELEVADTSEPELVSAKPALNHRLKIFSHGSSPHLQRADRAAFAIGGEIQFWNCPQGGVAFVLVIPKKRMRMVA